MTSDHPMGDEVGLTNRFDNPYLVAIQAKDRADQLEALVQFSKEEVESRYAECEDLMPEGDTDNLDPEDETEWSYEKGFLDAARLFYGLHLQAFWTHQTMARQDAETDDDDA